MTATYNANIPVKNQSPGLFPDQAQANFIRLKDIINNEHLFNDTGPPTPNNTDGIHRQVTLIARSAPTGAITVGNAVLYGFLDANNTCQLGFYNGVKTYQITPSEFVIAGTVTVPTNGSFVTISAVPADVYGEVFLSKGVLVSAGAFVAVGSAVNGNTYASKWKSGSSASNNLQLGFAGDGASASNLTVQNPDVLTNPQLNGVWNYRIVYRFL